MDRIINNIVAGNYELRVDIEGVDIKDPASRSRWFAETVRNKGVLIELFISDVAEHTGLRKDRAEKLFYHAMENSQSSNLIKVYEKMVHLMELIY